MKQCCTGTRLLTLTYLTWNLLSVGLLIKALGKS